MNNISINRNNKDIQNFNQDNVNSDNKISTAVENTQKCASKTLTIANNINSILDLPGVLLAHIFSFVGQSHLLRLSLVCKIFSDVVLKLPKEYRLVFNPNPFAQTTCERRKSTYFDLALYKYKKKEIGSKAIEKFLHYGNRLINDDHRIRIFHVACEVMDKELVSKFLSESEKLMLAKDENLIIESVKAQSLQTDRGPVTLQTIPEDSPLTEKSLLYHPIKPENVLKIFKEACAQKKADVLKFLLENKLHQMFEKYALYNFYFEACKIGNVDTIKLFLDLKDFKPTTKDQISAIREACTRNNHELIELLVKDGRIDTDGLNDKIIQNQLRLYLMKICKDKKLNPVKAFLKLKNIELALNESSSVLIEACKKGREKLIQILLKDGRIDPSTVLDDLLMHATKFNKKKLVPLLLQDERIKQTKYKCGSATEISLINWLFAHGEIGLLSKLIKQNSLLVANHNELVKLAIQHKSFDVVRLLLDRNPNIITEPVKVTKFQNSVANRWKVEKIDDTLLINVLRAVCESNDENWLDEIIVKIPSSRWKRFIEKTWNSDKFAKENPFYSAALEGNINVFMKLGKQVRSSNSEVAINHDIIENCLKIALKNSHHDFAEYIYSQFNQSKKIFDKTVSDKIIFRNAAELACTSGCEFIVKKELISNINWDQSFLTNLVKISMKANQLSIVKLILENSSDKLDSVTLSMANNYLRTGAIDTNSFWFHRKSK
jgi:hypothetical protein